MNLFETAHCLLTSLTDPAPNTLGAAPAPVGSLNDVRDADRLLLALDYVRTRDGDSSLRPTTSSATVRTNRLALLRLAGQFDQAFQVPMRHAPGAIFFGGIVSPRRFGLKDHVPESVGVAGRGPTLQRAFESCVGEAAEYLSFIEWGDEPTLENLDAAVAARSGATFVKGPNFGCGLTQKELEWALEGIGLTASADLATLDWMEAASITTGTTVAVPAELCLRRSESERKGQRPAESNGVGAGCSWDDAVLSGLMEAVERDAVALWWFGRRAARRLDPEVAQGTAFRKFMERVRGDSARKHWLLDLTTDTGISVVAALSAREDGREVIAGFSASLDLFDAMCNAALEMCQMELAQELAVAKLKRVGEQALLPQEIAWIERYYHLNLDDFPQLTPEGSAAVVDRSVARTPLAEAVRRLKKGGLTAYAVNLTRPAIGLSVARVLVPGLQSAKPDWVSHRLRSTAIEKKVQLHSLSSMLSPIK